VRENKSLNQFVREAMEYRVELESGYQGARQRHLNLVYAHDTSAREKHEAARDLVTGLWETGTGFRDALIVQSAVDGGASTICSEDLTHGQTVHGVVIMNPFS
jgi:hypothetical protein